jgi:RNA polymerase sigma-70 factor, ECF subfamily
MPRLEAVTDDLASLLAAAGRRDEKAFARLYDLTSSRMFGVALRLLRRRDWAEDVLQECYVNIWHHAAQYSMAQPLTWMTAIVRNRCLDWLRRPQTEQPVEDESMLEAIPDDAIGPLEQLVQSAAVKSIFRCMKGLAAKERQTIALAFFHGLTHSELAQHLREPLGTVKTYVRRGLQQLKECLDKPDR